MTATLPERPPTTTCNGLTRSRVGYCLQPAGRGTDHLGQGRCHIHGGANPIKHGRYSSIQRPRLRELIQAQADDPDPLNLLPEVQLLRAMVQDYLDRFEEVQGAIVAWHQAEAADAVAENRRPRPVRIPQIEDAKGLLTGLSQIAERHHRIQSSGAITLETLARVTEQMGVTVARHVRDPKALAAIQREWGQIQVDGPDPASRA